MRRRDCDFPFSARPQRIEVCRKLTHEEMEKSREHMRQRESCEGAFATYTCVSTKMADASVNPLFAVRATQSSPV